MYLKKFAKEITAFTREDVTTHPLTHVWVEPGTLVATDGTQIMTMEVELGCD